MLTFLKRPPVKWSSISWADTTTLSYADFPSCEQDEVYVTHFFRL